MSKTTDLTFANAQYKYKCFMYDVYGMTNVEYPYKEYSSIELGNWILKDCWNNYLCMVEPNGYVRIL